MRLRCDQRAEAARLEIGGQMLKFELRLCDDLFIGDVWARFRGCLQMNQMTRPPFSMYIPHLLGRGAQSLDNTRVLIETGVGLLKQAVDDINNPPPIGVYGFDVG
jgi:hypothetical protein